MSAEAGHPEPWPGSGRADAETGTDADARAGRPPRSLGLNLFAIPLGLGGLGGAWSAAIAALDAPSWPADALYTLSGIVWVVFSIVYTVQGIRRRGSFTDDLRHPGIGPFAAYIPVVGIVLLTHFGQYIPAAAPWIMGILVASLGVVAAQLFAHWIVGELQIESLHPGYFLPVVAGPFIASIGLSSVGAHEAAIGAFGVGAFFWLVVGTIVTGRLMTRSQLPDPLKPTLAVLVAPPATGGIAWFVANGGQTDTVETVLAGVIVMMLLVQFLLLPVYGRLSFSLTFWAFTFPAASASNYAIRWFEASPFDGWQAVSWLVLALATAVVAVIGAASIVTVLRGRRASTS